MTRPMQGGKGVLSYTEVISIHEHQVTRVVAVHDVATTMHARAPHFIPMDSKLQPATGSNIYHDCHTLLDLCSTQDSSMLDPHSREGVQFRKQGIYIQPQYTQPQHSTNTRPFAASLHIFTTFCIPHFSFQQTNRQQLPLHSTPSQLKLRTIHVYTVSLHP